MMSSLSNSRGRRGWLCAALAAVAGCGSVSSGHDAAPADAPPVQGCDPTGTFSAPVAITQLALPGIFEFPPRLSSDERTIYFTGQGDADTNLYVAHRASLDAAFGTPALVTNANSATEDRYATVSGDDLLLMFESNRTENQGFHLYQTRRPADGDFPAAALASLNDADVATNDAMPFLTADNTELWFTSSRAGGLGNLDIWRAPRSGDTFGTPVAVPELNSASDEWVPMVSADRLTVYFASDRAAAGVTGGMEIWRAKRTTTDDGFGAPVLVSELNTAADDLPGWLSADNCRLYLGSNVLGNGNIYVATRQP